MLKKKYQKIILIFTILFISSLSYKVFSAPPASPYNPGETLEPNCSYGEVNCSNLGPIHKNDYLTDIANINPSQGDIIYYNGSDWVNLSAGVNGQYLKTQGAGADPIWQNAGIIPQFSNFNDSDNDTKILTEQVADEDHIRFITNGQERLTITNTGRFGIGRTNPSVKFHVNGSISANNFINSYGSVSSPAYRFANNANLGFFASSTDNFADDFLGFSVEGIEILTLSTSTMYLGTSRGTLGPVGSSDNFIFQSVSTSLALQPSIGGKLIFTNNTTTYILVMNDKDTVSNNLGSDIYVRGTGNGGNIYPIFNVSGNNGNSRFNIANLSADYFSYFNVYESDGSTNLIYADGETSNVFFGAKKPYWDGNLLLVYNQHSWQGQTVAYSGDNDNGPAITMLKGRGLSGNNIGSAQVNDWAGGLHFKIVNSLKNVNEIAAVHAQVTNINSGSEEGKLYFYVRDSGANWNSKLFINKYGLGINTFANSDNIVNIENKLAVRNNNNNNIFFYTDDANFVVFEMAAVEGSAPIARIATNYDEGEKQAFNIESIRNYPIVFITNTSSEKMRISEVGRVGIGTNSPGELLDVHGAIHINPDNVVASPTRGDIYYDSVSHKLRCYDGANWHDLW